MYELILSTVVGAVLALLLVVGFTPPPKVILGSEVSALVAQCGTHEGVFSLKASNKLLLTCKDGTEFYP